MCISHYFKPNGIHVHYRQKIPDLRQHRLNNLKVWPWRKPYASRLVDAVRVARSPWCARSVCSSFLLPATVLYTFRTVFRCQLCVYILLNKLGSRCTTQGTPDLRRQLTVWSSERNFVVSRGASMQVSPYRHVDDVTTNITDEAAESSHNGCSHKRTATRVMASYALSVTRASLFLFIQFNAQGLCAPAIVSLLLSVNRNFYGTLQRGNVSSHSATDMA